MEIQTIKNKLSVRQESLLMELPAVYRNFVLLRMERPIAALSDSELTGHLLQIITKAHLDQSPKSENNDSILVAQTTILKAEITGRFKELTIAELAYAFHHGVRGEAGEYFGLCGKTYHKFMKWMCEFPDRQESWVKWLEKLDTADRTEGLSEDQKKKNSERALQKLFEDYRSTGTLGQCPWFYYGALCDLIGFEVEYLPGKFYKTIIKEPEDRKLLEEMSQREYNEVMSYEQLEDDSIYKKGSVQDAYMNLIIMKGLTKEERLIRIKRKNALKHYFDCLIKNNTQWIINKQQPEPNTASEI